MKLAYVRVSTVDQSEQRQRVALEAYEIEKWFIDIASAKDTNRPKLQELLSFCREGDTIYIMDYSRIARSTKDLLALIEHFQQKQVALISHKEKLDTNTGTGKFMLTIIGAVNEFERQILLERQKEGIAIAKEKGVYQNRPQGIDKISKEDWDKFYAQYLAREINKTQLAKKLKISRTTLYKILGEMRSQLKTSPST